MLFYVVPIYYFIMSMASHIQAKSSVNIFHGIRNKYSMRTDEHWDFAHKTTAKWYFIIGIIVLIATAIGSMLFNFENNKILVVIIQLIPIALVRAISKKEMIDFDEKYKERLKKEGNYKLLVSLYKEDK